jgi:hypothetical protein
MARPRSIYERGTSSTLPPPERRERSHVVEQGESLITIANRMFSLEEYDPGLWREIGLVNRVDNPFTFDPDFVGERIRVPGRPLPAYF